MNNRVDLRKSSVVHDSASHRPRPCTRSLQFSQMITDLTLMLKWTTTTASLKASSASRFVCKQKNPPPSHPIPPFHLFTIHGRVWNAVPFVWHLTGSRPVIKTAVSLCASWDCQASTEGGQGMNEETLVSPSFRRVPRLSPRFFFSTGLHDIAGGYCFSRTERRAPES